MKKPEFIVLIFILCLAMFGQSIVNVFRYYGEENEPVFTLDYDNPNDFDVSINIDTVSLVFVQPGNSQSQYFVTNNGLTDTAFMDLIHFVWDDSLFNCSIWIVEDGHQYPKFFQVTFISPKASFGKLMARIYQHVPQKTD